MLPPDYRFWSPSGALLPGGPHIWHIIDFDQRKWIAVSGPEKTLPEDTDAIEILKRNTDRLGPDVHRITVNEKGDIISISTKIKHDETEFVHYPRYDPQDMTYAGRATLTRSQMVEVDRVVPTIDLVRYEDGPGKAKLAIFKYTVMWRRMPQMWRELHIMMGLPRHEYIVPFSRIVLDDVDPRILGFTIDFIPGGTFDDNKTRPFRFAWLQQLTSVVDDLNLKFGIIPGHRWAQHCC